MTRAVFSNVFRDSINMLARWFPIPKMLLPLTVGVDISGTAIKWIVLSGEANERRVLSFGQESISEGIIVNGIVQDVSALAQVLGEMKKKLGGIEFAHAALPEEAAYVFSMHIPENSSRKQALSMIEFELEDRVPIAPADALYDFDVIMKNNDGVGVEIGVVVFPRDLAESYAEVFQLAKMRLCSLEVGANSIARAVSKGSLGDPVTLLVDFGRFRTSFAILKRGKPIFTSTVAIGGETIDKAIMQKLSLSREDITTFKNEQGFLAKGGKVAPGVEALSGTVAALADEVVRHYQYWDTRRNERGERVTPVERVFIVGGGANLRGLTDYIAARVQAECTRPNVWQNVCSFDDYIPPIDRRESLQYATAIGLALRGI